nr:MerR family transcriptional regulator [Streptomyces sp. HNM0574]
MRPVDLARAAGASTQWVRDCEDSGVLPPVPRTASGYRLFDARHLDALLTYRALTTGYGTAAARETMRAVQAGDLPRALALVDASHAALHEERRALREAGEALEAVAGERADSDVLPDADLRIGEVAGCLGVRTSALRVWESAGLIAPARQPGTGYRVFSPADVRDARMVHLLRRSHHRLPRIRLVLDGLRETGSREALREALVRRDEALTARARAMLAGSGALHRYLSGAD